MMEKVQGFAQEGKFRPGASGSEVQGDYESDRTDAYRQVEALHITKRIASTGISICSLGAESLLTLLQAR